MARRESSILNLHEHTALISEGKSRYDSISKLDDSENQSKAQDLPDPRTLKTFGGVFTPVALCQFSTLLFLRIGFIIGSVGLYAGFGTLCLAYGIILTTVLSVSAIATNGAIEGGGVYFMISRILGPQFGGAVGVLFLFANIMGSALYNIGCIDGVMESFGTNAGDLAILRILPSGPWHMIGYRTLLNVFNLCVCCIGAKMFTKTVVFLFGVVFVSAVSLIVSFVAVDGPIEIPIPEENALYSNLTGEYTGLATSTLLENLYPEYVTDYTTNSVVYYATVFSVIYSGLTGITNGANMSGELKNPGFSIPVGTLSALFFTFFTYCILFLLTAFSCSRFVLQNNYSFMVGINLWPPLVTVGVITATMSSSLSKMIGASRVLEAIVKDKLFGSALNWVGKGTIRSNPIGCVFVCFLVVQCSIMVGKLNTVAIIASIFFLMSHMSTNIACFCLEWASAPNFRPTFKYFSWWTAFLGILGNGCMMFVVSPIYSVIGIMACLIIISGLHLGTPILSGNWGSISQAILYHQVRKFLLKLDSRKDHVKFWRPQILLMVSDPRYCCPLLDFVNDLKKSGLYIIGHVMVQDFEGEGLDPTLKSYPKWQSLVDHLKIKAFIEVTMANSVRNGVQHLARIAGLGAMKPNTVVLGFWDDSSCQNFFQSECSPYFVKLERESLNRERRSTRKKKEVANVLCNWEKGTPTPPKMDPTEYVGIVKDLLNMGKNVCLCRHFQFLDKEMLLGRSNSEKHFIDVWPMNFFDINEVNLECKSSHFALQLATILNMVPLWKKKTRIRVFLCMNTSEPRVLEKEKAYIFDLLQGLRINATIAVLSLENISLMRKWASDENFQASSTNCTDGITPFYQLPESYLKGVNLLVRENSFHSALNFMTLPAPPANQDHYQYYLHALTAITHGLPPTVLVHGLSTVMDSCL